VKTCGTEKMMDDKWVALREKGNPKKMRMEKEEDLKDMVTSTILLCLANKTLRKVIGLTDTVDIWDKLEIHYKSK